MDFKKLFASDHDCCLVVSYSHRDPEVWSLWKEGGTDPDMGKWEDPVLDMEPVRGPGGSGPRGASMGGRVLEEFQV